MSDHSSRHTETTVVHQESVHPRQEPTLSHTPVYHADVSIPTPPPARRRESAARDRVRRRRVQSRRAGGEWAWAIVALAMLGVVIVIGMSVTLLLRATQAQETPITAAPLLPTPVDARIDLSGATLIPGQQLNLGNGTTLPLVPWNGTARLTILVMGLDRRPGESGLSYRTDTMMLVSLDPRTQAVGMLSIPRDLYVEVPGYNQLQRVNTAMVLGELQQPGFGPQLTLETIQYNLGIRIHNYLVVDFSAFVEFIDLLGGLEIEIPYSISDPLYPDMNYGYDPFYIEAGLQQLNGATTLKYARTRHGDNDFVRAQRQQLVLYAIRNRLVSPDILPQLVVQSPNLWNTFSEGVYTNLTLEQTVQLALYMKDMPQENIRGGVINERYIMNYTTPQGASVLVPDRANIGPLMVEIFGDNYSE